MHCWCVAGALLYALLLLVRCWCVGVGCCWLLLLFTRAHTHTHTRARAHTHTHTHTHLRPRLLHPLGAEEWRPLYKAYAPFDTESAMPIPFNTQVGRVNSEVVRRHLRFAVAVVTLMTWRLGILYHR